MRYPAECPVFEVTTQGRFLAPGKVVEWSGDFARASDLGAIPDDGGPMIGVRVIDDADLSSTPSSACRHPRDGWYRLAIDADALRPLTRAAREMLALVRK